MKTPDEILVQRALDGDKSSFGILVEQYRNSVFRHSIKTTRDFHEAEDITQDVFAEAYLNLPRLREPAKFGNWLRGITQNLCRMWMRKKRVLSDLEIPLDNLQTEVLNQWLREQENSESWEFGTDVVNKLSDEQKNLLKLFYIDNRPCHEIAQQMGASEVAIRKRLSRTRQQLKTELLEGEKNMNRMIAISAMCAFLLGGALSVSGGTWRDGFEHPELGEWEVHLQSGNQPVWKIENGLLLGDHSGLSMAWIGKNTWEDYSVEATVTLLEEQPPGPLTPGSSGAGIVIYWRVLPCQGHHYGIFTRLWDGREAGVFAVFADGWGIPAASEYRARKLHLGHKYKLNMTEEKEIIKCYLDGELVLELNKRYAAGVVGLYSWNMRAHFDDFVVTGTDIPDGGPGFPVNRQAKLANTWGRIKQVD
ncbi:sigma-70 family RNA polymerase sigma factor [bacterium]|nr:sigma-70 family RNA polymerase sigma factor [bacterium]